MANEKLDSAVWQIEGNFGRVEDTRSNKDVACEVLREIALHSGVTDDIRVQAASLLLSADDDDYSSAMLEIDAIADAVAERLERDSLPETATEAQLRRRALADWNRPRWGHIDTATPRDASRIKVRVRDDDGQRTAGIGDWDKSDLVLVTETHEIFQVLDVDREASELVVRRGVGSQPQPIPAGGEVVIIGRAG